MRDRRIGVGEDGGDVGASPGGVDHEEGGTCKGALVQVHEDAVIPMQHGQDAVWNEREWEGRHAQKFGVAEYT